MTCIWTSSMYNCEQDPENNDSCLLGFFAFLWVLSEGIKMSVSAISEMESVIRKNMESRGLSEIKTEGTLEESARSLMKAESVVIVTGFVIREAMIGETDGPLGAAALGSSLLKLGKRVVFVTDTYSEQLIKKACTTLAMRVPIEVATHENILSLGAELKKAYHPTHLIAIERPGRHSDGKCYSMKGEDLSDLVPNTDILFEAFGAETIAIGDGGNEVGMGNIKAQIQTKVENGSQICAEMGTDHLILAGVSNWGGYALAGALSVLSGSVLIHGIKEEQDMMTGILSVGAVDGCTKKNAPTVDGLSFEENAEILSAIHASVEAGIKTFLWR